MYHLSLSSHFHNKTVDRAGNQAYNFESGIFNLDEITSHILSGNAIAVAQLKNGHRKNENFISSSIIGLDFDDNVSVADILAHPYSYLLSFVHPSASSTPDCRKSRGYGLLSIPTFDKQKAKNAILTFQWLFSVSSPDPSTKDIARLFYGSDNKSDDIYIKESPISPETLEALMNEYVKVNGAFPKYVESSKKNSRTKDSKNQRNGLTLGIHREAKAPKAHSKIQKELLSQALDVIKLGDSGKGRHNALFKLTQETVKALLTKKISLEWLTELLTYTGIKSGKFDEWDYSGRGAERELESLINGRIAFFEDIVESKEESFIEALGSNTLDIAKASHTIDSRYFSIPKALLDKPEAIIWFDSPMDTGKTTFTNDFLSELALDSPDIQTLTLTPRNSLGNNVKARRNSLDTVTHLEELREAQHIVSSTESLYKLDNFIPDVLVIEEITLTLKQLLSSTQRNGTSSTNHLIRLLRNTPRVIVGQHIAETWVISALTYFSAKPVYVYRNEFKPQSNELLTYVLGSTKSLISIVLDKVLELKKEGKKEPVIFHSASIRDALNIRTRAQELGINVRIITGQNSREPESIELTALPDKFIPEYELFVYTNTWVTGVDIKTEAHFYSSHSPFVESVYDAVQADGRVRNKLSSHVLIPFARSLETLSAQERYTELKAQAEYSAELLGVSLNHKEQEPLMQIVSLVEASLDALKVNFVGNYHAMAKDNYKSHTIQEMKYKERHKEEYAKAEQINTERRAQVAQAMPPLPKHIYDALPFVYEEDTQARLKHKIMSLLGVNELTLEMWQDLEKDSTRKKLRALISILGDGKAEELHSLRELDSKKGYNLYSYQYAIYSARKSLLNFFGIAPELETLTENLSSVEITKSEFLALYEANKTDFDTIFKVIKTRSEHSSEPWRKALQLLREMGLPLKKVTTKRVNGTVENLFRFDLESIEALLVYARMHYENKEKQEQERKENVLEGAMGKYTYAHNLALNNIGYTVEDYTLERAHIVHSLRSESTI